MPDDPTFIPEEESGELRPRVSQTAPRGGGVHPEIPPHPAIDLARPVPGVTDVPTVLDYREASQQSKGFTMNTTILGILKYGLDALTVVLGFLNVHVDWTTKVFSLPEGAGPFIMILFGIWFVLRTILGMLQSKAMADAPQVAATPPPAEPDPSSPPRTTNRP